VVVHQVSLSGGKKRDGFGLDGVGDVCHVLGGVLWAKPRIGGVGITSWAG
jgi:hypothetical protein